MLLRRSILRNAVPVFQSLRLLRAPHTRSQLGTPRWASTIPPTAKAGAKKFLFPERLIIYHAGTGRTTFLGCFKVTTIFIAAFFCVVVAPTHFYSDEPKWVAGCVLLSGIIPVLLMTYISTPYVTYIHLRLPAFARQSREMLMRYAASLPKTAELDFTTLNLVGMPRVARVKIVDLRPVSERAGFANLKRDTRELNVKRPWYMGRAQSQFGVHNRSGGVMKGEVWEVVRRSIGKNR